MGREQRSRGVGAYIKGDSFKVVFKYSRLSLSCIEKKKKKKKISDTTVGRGEKGTPRKQNQDETTEIYSHRGRVIIKGGDISKAAEQKL